MTPLLKKLNFKAQSTALVLNAPDEFAVPLEELKQHLPVDIVLKTASTYDFILVFAYTNDDIRAFAQQLEGHLATDATLWYAYIKKSSKKHKSALARDTEGWQVLADSGYEGVRQVAIDTDWSAIRFRHVDFIKTMTRSFARSKKGKERTKGGI